ncbi:MAG: histidine phosphatase family protein [Alphaproteobacteria bacterium]|nr:histidine phosphatase family protein [Alphaproteobacteria bacterium]
MKTLYLLRHAKSSWTDPTLEDHERTLNERGRRTAPLMGAYMREHGYVPDYVLCSSARRTLETLELLRPSLEPGTPVDVDPGIYHVPAPTMMRVVRRLPPASDRALIIGHNPGLEDLIEMLARPDGTRAELEAREKLAAGFPTAGFAVLRADVSAWDEVMPQACQLVCVVKPKELADLDD